MLGMSWEVVGQDLRPCPCGAGRYRIEYRSDDWGRSEEDWSMECPACAKSCALTARGGWDSGISVSYQCWVPRSLFSELTNLDDEIRRETDGVAKVARERYRAKWHSHFEGMSKRRIWAHLTDAGKEYPSLSAFYAHVKHPTGLNGVLDGYFRLEHLPRVFRILNIADAELDQRIGQIAEAQSLREMKCEAMFRQART